MATCVSSESNPFTPSPSFTLKPRGEKCSTSASHFGALRLAPSFGRGLRIRSSFDGQDQTMFDAQNFTCVHNCFIVLDFSPIIDKKVKLLFAFISIFPKKIVFAEK